MSRSSFARLAAGFLAVLAVLAMAVPTLTSTNAARRDEAGHQRLELIQQVGGATRAIAAHGEFVYMGVGPRVVVFDVSNRANPLYVGQSPPLPGLVDRLTVAGAYAYAASSEGSGVHVLDVSDPSALAWVSSVPIEASGNTFSWIAIAQIVERAGFLFVAMRTAGLRVLDVRDPVSAAEVGSYHGADSVNSLLVADGIAYMHCHCNGWVSTLRILDVSDPTSIAVLADYDRPVAPMALSGHRLLTYVPSERFLDIVDVADPSQPVTIATVELPRLSLAAGVIDDFLLVRPPSQTGELQVFDIANPDQPRLVGSLTGVAGGAGVVVGKHLFRATSEAGLLVVDFSDPTRPVKVAEVPFMPVATSVDVNGGRAYASGTFSGIEVWDIADPRAPARLGRIDGVSRVAAFAGRFLIAAGAGIRIVDASDPTRPVTVGFFEGSVSGAAASWPHVYAVDLYGGITVLDLAAPTLPTVIASVPASQFERARAALKNIALAGRHAYVATGSGDLRIVDISDPSKPIEVGSFPLGVDGWGVAVEGAYAYVADGVAGLRVIDVSEPTAPFEVGSFDTPGDARAVAVKAGHAYVADGPAGVRVIDVSDPTNPNEVAARRFPGVAEDLALNRDDIVVAVRDLGLWILRLEPYVPQ
jgi:hypothetical protein